MKQIFITGGTGYIGKRLIKLLLTEGYIVKALVRKGSESKLSAQCEAVIADAFDAASFTHEITEDSIFIQLLGVAHPDPTKGSQFKAIDLVSAKASADAAKQAGVMHFIYVSVAQTPTKIMKVFQQCRAEAEAYIANTKVPATFIRPWYVVGPGHYWVLLLIPIIKILEWIPATSAKAKALGLVTIEQMISTLLYAVDHPPVSGVNIIEIENIRKLK